MTAQKLLCYECVIQGNGYNKLHLWNNLTIARLSHILENRGIQDKIETVSIIASSEELVNNWLLSDMSNFTAGKLVFPHASFLYVKIEDTLDDGYDSDYSTDSYDVYLPSESESSKPPLCGKSWQI
ncbi:hypothetical protein J3B02_000775 [Coemansia erecta]|uniref:Uncharacterized protein n=1 Tax=Coemansia asiatica TaxID=1052880 RepID=A0A9W7XKZ7_9FUNG|nr:hypothetical protein LPJ64_002988 [Coemansia asiatica]KAJ2857775.1 hypothetical protein J3B02_000775 [Coemansia erecta]